MHASAKRDPEPPPLDEAAGGTAPGREPDSLGTAWLWLNGRPYLLLILTMLGWAGNAVASRLAVGAISPMALTTLRWSIACVLLALFVRRDIAAAWPPLRARWRYVLALAAVGFTAFNALMYVAAHSTGAVNLTILQGAIPVFVLLGALAAFGTRIRPSQALGVAVTLVGVALVAAHGDLATTKEKLTVDELLAMMEQPGVVFTTTPSGVMLLAEQMVKGSTLKTSPKDWKECFFPFVHGQPGN